MPELNVSQKSIEQFLTIQSGSVIEHPRFIIPDYQRPYRWNEEKCEILWDDFVTFFYNRQSEEDVYFLGSIVTCKTAKGFEVIDGQQRITTILLFLVACYRYVRTMHEHPDVKGLQAGIEKCVWQMNKKTQEVDYQKIYITSEVINEDNESLYGILTDCNYKNEKSQHYKNYKFFEKKLQEFAQKNPRIWIDLCMAFMDHCVIFPIECATQDSALTIFSTLNNRGLPLADSDIFKAHIYRSRTTEDEKNQFAEEWKELNSILDDAEDLSLDDLFRFYSHFIRAKHGNRQREVGMRVFYTQKISEKEDYRDVLKAPATMLNLKQLAVFWKSVLRRENVFLDKEAQKFLHCLTCYPNEYWKYITSVLVLRIYEQPDEDETHVQNKIRQILPVFLKKLTAFLVSRFIFKPTVNSIKDDIFNAYCQIYSGEELKFQNPIQKELLGDLMKKAALSSSRISRCLILLHAYLQDGQVLIPENFQIEHIMPQKWQNTNYNGWSEKEASECLELFGNKSPIEKKLNIQAGNAYFSRKKAHYRKSCVQELRGFAEDESLTDWAKAEILNRDDRFTQTVGTFFETQLEPD